MTKKQAWISALRLRTLPLSISGILLGSSIAASKGFSNPVVLTLALVTTVLFQILSNLANDLGDSIKGTDNAGRIGPTRAVQSGIISLNEMKKAVILLVILSLASAGFLIYFSSKGLNLQLIYFYCALAILSILAAISYTIGKKAYGYHGFGDLMVFLFFGWISVLGVYPLFAKNLDWNLLLPATGIGLLCTSVLNLNNMRDYANDKRSDKNTLVVIIGPNFAKMYHALLILGGLTFMGIYMYQLKHSPAFIGLLPGVYLIYHVRKVMQTKDPRMFDPDLKFVALSTFAVATLTSIGLFINN